MLDITLAMRTQLGQRQGNEDTLASACSGPACYALLADGAGGHQRGAEASQRAIASLEAACLAALSTRLNPQWLNQAVLAAHEELRRGQQVHGTERMYTTLVALCLDGAKEQALWSHVGDSRLYRLRHGVVMAQTVDDSVVQRMLDRGMLSAEQARNHPLKNQLIAALGIDDDLEPHTLAQPVTLEDGDVFLLCSDGWWEPLGEADMALTLADADSPRDWLDAMQARIEARARPRQDNFSAIAVWVGDPREDTRAMPDLE
jgi:PPM family protein phosphatase